MVITMYYINMFFLFSIIGHFIENFFYSNIDSGILYGFWTPIYGLGVLLIILINNILKKVKLNKLAHFFFIFLICATTISLLELIGGYTIELLFDRVFWDYSNLPLNIGKYTSLSMCLIWGSASVLFLYILKPIAEVLIKKTPKHITYILSILFIIDVIITIINRVNLINCLI